MIKISRLSQAAVLDAASNWRLSVDRVQLVVDQAIANGSSTPTVRDRDAFCDALAAFYDLEAAIFGPVHMELPDEPEGAVAPGLQPSFQAAQPPA